MEYYSTEDTKLYESKRKILPEDEGQAPWLGDDLDCPNCGAMLELLEGGMLACRLCGFADNDTAEVKG